jgi:hypothetical protein
MFVSFKCCELPGRGPCIGLITPPGVLQSVVCVIVKLRRPGPLGVILPKKKKKNKRRRKEEE